MKIGIINAGLGNIKSIQRMLEQVGASGVLVSSPKEVIGCEALILPGVGHFDEGIRSLRSKDLIEIIKERVIDDNVLILGICLGMQLLTRGSEEGSEQGLGLIDAVVKKFQFIGGDSLKVPHMGWNVVKPVKSNKLIPLVEYDQRFYFVHSYRVVPDDSGIIIGMANYGNDFCAAFQSENVFGVQFHPEKSHRFGKDLIKRFIEL